MRSPGFPIASCCWIAFTRRWRTRRGCETKLALLYLDLDGFKAVNDALGHTTGDELLKRVSVRLLACIRASDTVCRHGGDEFVILLTEVADDEGALLAAEKIRAHLAMPYVIGATAIQLTTSIGVAVYPIDGREIRRASAAFGLRHVSQQRRHVEPPQHLQSRPDACHRNRRIHAWDRAELLEQEAGSPPGKDAGSQRKTTSPETLPGGSSGTVIRTTPSELAGSPCGFLQTP